MLPKADSSSFVLFSLLFVLTLTDPPRTGKGRSARSGAEACRTGRGLPWCFKPRLCRLFQCAKALSGVLPSGSLTKAPKPSCCVSEQRCSPGQFACRSGKMQCIPMSWQCDGWTACEDKSDEIDCPPAKEERFHFGNGYDQGEDVIGVAQPVRFNKKCPSGWHHYEKTASCYKVYLRNENYWQAVDTCQKVNGSLATFVTNEELQFILKIEVDFDDDFCERRDQCKFWVGYQYVITNQSHSLEGRWEVAYKGSMQVFLPPEGLTKLGETSPAQDNVFCAQLQRFQIKTMNDRGLHSWHAENCYKKFPFLCKRSTRPPPQRRRGPARPPGRGLDVAFPPTGQTCVDIKDNVVNEGYYFTPKGDDPCLSCTCHDGEPEMCVAALCERPQGCQHFRKDPKECCKFTCLDPDGNSLFDSMASGMRLIVSCISSFLILSLLLFMVHRLRQRRRERIETWSEEDENGPLRLTPPPLVFLCPVHHFNLGRRVPGFDYGPDAFGTGLTPLHLSDDGEGGAFHFQEPPPPYAAYKYPDMQHPDDPPPPYEASINPDSLLYVDLGRHSSPLLLSECHQVQRHRGVSMVPSQMNAIGDRRQPDIPHASGPMPDSVPPSQGREDSIDSSTLLVGPDTPTDGHAPVPADCAPSLSTVV
ncbi:unnamed protein product [Menidia menidia]|uniref:(Atlantic silverside) hypothetical protein n=1 Tax=Menidia menidia TaxID=238744 RepID=A0A8S4AFM6_9TELE|nr:unnamed protein product [Menidia menidia]